MKAYLILIVSFFVTSINAHKSNPTRFSDRLIDKIKNEKGIVGVFIAVSFSTPILCYTYFKNFNKKRNKKLPTNCDERYSNKQYWHIGLQQVKEHRKKKQETEYGRQISNLQDEIDKARQNGLIDQADELLEKQMNILIKFNSLQKEIE